MFAKVIRDVVDKRFDESRSSAATERSMNFQLPAPLKISNSNYAHDDTFKQVSLILLSRYQGLETSATETISATLTSQQEQSAFYEALRVRLALLQRQEMHTASLAQQIETVFGEALRNMCHHHHVLTNSQKLGEQPGMLHQLPPPPITPRNKKMFSCFRAHGGGGCPSNINNNKPMGPPASRRRSFFPDGGGGDGKPAVVIRNIDWQLANAVQQVVSLSLDGPPPTEKRDFACYEPPTTPMHCQAV